MTIVPTQPRLAKKAYYGGCGMKSTLAVRYWRQFPGARRVLDVGCGLGEFGRYGPPDVEVHGVDIDAGAIEKALEFEHAISLDLDSEPLPYEAGSFDAALAKDVLEHLRDPARVVRDIYRVLRPGGVLVVSVVMAKPRAVWADYTHVRGFTKRSARLLFEDAGFQVEAVWRMGGVPLSGRLRFIWLVPMLLRLPVFGWLWASSWELKARR